MNGFQRMRHQLAVEHGVDRAADAHQLGAMGQRGCLRQSAKLQPGAAVVEQDAAVEVADHHALGEFGHQRGQAVFFLLHAAAGQRDLLRHVLAQAVALGCQFVDAAGQRAQLWAAVGRELLRFAGGQQHAGLLQQARRGAGVAQVEPMQPIRHARQRRHPAHAEQGDARPQHRAHGFAIGRLQRGPDQRQAQGHPGGQGQPDGGNRQDQPSIRLLHGCAPSISATFCTSSRVENGFVM